MFSVGGGNEGWKLTGEKGVGAAFGNIKCSTLE
jgi:hypothetical protein